MIFNNSKFLIRNYEGQKKVAQYFSIAKRKELSTQNLMFTKNMHQ